MRLKLCAISLLLACGGGDKDSGVGPALTESEYLTEYPSLFCGVLEQCDAEVFQASYGGDLQQCVDEITTIGRDRINQDCAFDGAAAASCVHGLQSVTCEAWADGTYQESCGAIIDC